MFTCVSPCVCTACMTLFKYILHFAHILSCREWWVRHYPVNQIDLFYLKSHWFLTGDDVILGKLNSGEISKYFAFLIPKLCRSIFWPKSATVCYIKHLSLLVKDRLTRVQLQLATVTPFCYCLLILRLKYCYLANQKFLDAKATYL